MKTIKVIVPAWQIPDEATVSKRTGTKKYLLRRKITIYNHSTEKESPQNIEAKENTVFLVSTNGNIEAYGGKVELIWYTDYHGICSFLSEHDYDL